MLSRSRVVTRSDRTEVEGLAFNWGKQGEMREEKDKKDYGIDEEVMMMMMMMMEKKRRKEEGDQGLFM